MDYISFNSREYKYKYPFGAIPNGSTVTLRVLLPRAISCRGVFLKIRRDDNPNFDTFPMYWDCMDGNDFEWWKIEKPIDEQGLYWYHFEYSTAFGDCNIMQSHAGLSQNNNEGREWQLTVYDKDFTTPDWIKGGVIYQIFPDRFARSGQPIKKTVPKDRVIRDDWGAQPEWRPNKQGKVLNNDYFAGDLKGIEGKLDYLQSLGVTCIYLNPIFEANSNHRYDTADYNKIDCLLGNQRDFESLCKRAAEKGIRIVLDGVFSHTGDDSVYFNKKQRYKSVGAYNSQESPYYSWYKFKNWPDEYDSWWGFETLPEVNEENPEYLDFITGENGVIRKWLRLGASGWRLDVADELPDVFIDALTKAAKAEKPDAVVMGEVWEDASNKCSYGSRRRYLLGAQFDSIMNYPFADAVLHYLSTGEAEGFSEKIIHIIENYPPQVLHCLMNHIGTHDTVRAITALAAEPVGDRGREWQYDKHLSAEQKDIGIQLMKLASAIQFTLPGVPSIYYGDEIGMDGYKDPFNRYCYDWENGDDELREWYKVLGKLRSYCDVLVDGDFHALTSCDGVVAYERLKGDSGVLTVVNRNARDVEYTITNANWDEMVAIVGVAPEDNVFTMPANTCTVLGWGEWAEKWYEI